MFPEVGATELLVIAAVALIVVGPKDLPVLMRKVGQFMARMRGMASEFRASFDEMARQSELDELRREVEALRSGQYLSPPEAASSAHQAGLDAMHEIEQEIAGLPHLGDPHYSAPEARTPEALALETEAQVQPAAKPRSRAAKPAVAKAPSSKTVAKAPAIKARATKAPAAEAPAATARKVTPRKPKPAPETQP